MKVALDTNGDGFIWKDEFINELKEPFNTLKDFYKIMDGIDVDNALALEEKMLHMKYSKSFILKEIR